MPITQVIDRPQPRVAVPVRGTPEHRLRLTNQLPEIDFFKFDLPEGWKRIEGTSNRNPNFAITDAPSVEAYVSVLAPKRGNTMVSNVARWHHQMGLDADSVDEKTVEALAEDKFIGRPARIVDLRGDFDSGRKTIPGARLLSLVQELPNAFVTFKIVGPENMVDALEDEFWALAKSFRLNFDEPKQGAHAPRDGGQRKPGPPPAAVKWTRPESWNPEPPNSFLLAAFRPKAHPETRCTISRAGGDMKMNLDRWRGQMGQPPISAEDIKKLPTRKVLGTDAYLITLDGDFTGAMRQPAMKGARLLGIIVVRPSESLFVKMLGPKDVMATEEANFFALCDSLEEDA